MAKTWNNLQVRIVSFFIIALCDFCGPAQGKTWMLLDKEYGVFNYFAYFTHRGYHLGIILTALAGAGIVARLGAKKVLSYGLPLMIVILIAAPASSSVGQLIFLRITQGLVSGLCIAAGMQIFTKTYPAEKINIPVTLTTVILVSSAAMSCLVGSYIGFFIGWRWTYWFLLPMFIVVYPFALWLIPKDGETKKVHIDLPVIGFLGVILLSYYYIMLYGHKSGWLEGSDIVIAGAVGITTLITLIIYTYKNPSDIFDINLFSKPSFLAGCALSFSASVINAIAIFTMTGMIMNLIGGTFVDMMFGQYCVMLGTMIGTYAIANVLKQPTRLPITLILGGTCYIIYGLFFSNLTGEVTKLQIATFILLGSIGTGTILVSAQSVGVIGVDKEDFLKAKTIIRMVHIGGHGMMICSTRWFSSVFTVVNYNNMRDGVLQDNPEVQQYIKSQAHKFGGWGHDAADASKAAIVKLSGVIKNEATIVSYIQDANIVMTLGILIVVGTTLTLLYTRAQDIHLYTAQTESRRKFINIFKLKSRKTSL